MAVDNTKKSYPFMEFPLSMARQDAFPLDKTAVFSGLDAAENYAQNDPTAYVGQVISVVTEGVSSVYQIKNTQGDLEQLGGMDGLDIATEEDVQAMLEDVFVAE